MEHLALAAAVTALALAAGAQAADPALTRSWRTDFSRHLVSLSEFQSGGPGKDGIPALDHPRFAPASSIGWLASREPVIELAVGRDDRPYPLQILIWHEIVNDRSAASQSPSRSARCAAGDRVRPARRAAGSRDGRTAFRRAQVVATTAFG